MAKSVEHLAGYSLAGIPQDKLDQADDLLEQAGLTRQQREAALARANLSADDSVGQMVEKALRADSTLDAEPAPEPEGESAPNLSDLRADYRARLVGRGLNRAAAARVVNAARIDDVDEPQEAAWERIQLSADELGYRITPDDAPVADGVLDQDTTQDQRYREAWVQYLVSRGMKLPVAERLIRNTKFKAGEPSEIAWDRIVDQARVARIKIPPRSAAEAAQTPDVITPMNYRMPSDREFLQGAEAAAATTAQQLADGLNRASEWAEGLPAPGGVAGPLFVMIVLWFIFIPVLYSAKGVYTRAHLMFLALIGDAELTDKNPPPEKVIPPNPMVEAVGEIADAAHEFVSGYETVNKIDTSVENKIKSAESAVTNMDKYMHHKFLSGLGAVGNALGLDGGGAPPKHP